MLVLPRSATFDFSGRLKAYFTNNQAKYEAPMFSLELLGYMGVKHMKVFGDSQLIVQKNLEEYQCLDATLNGYLERCWDIIQSFDEFDIRHISRAENCNAKGLTQDASGYRIKRGRFHKSESPITDVGLSTQVADGPGWITGPFAIGSDRLGKGSGPFGDIIDIHLVDSTSNAADSDIILDQFELFDVRFVIRSFCWSHVSLRNCNHEITGFLMYFCFERLFYLN
jgi:ribonuclease HI